MRVVSIVTPRSLPAVLASIAIATGVAGCLGPNSPKGDQIKDASKACDRKDGPSCFYAGALAADGKTPTSEAIKLWVKGCTLKHAESCESLALAKGPLREQALVEGCNAGDLVSCNRRANEFPKDEKAGEARALRQQVCKTASAITPQTTGRDLRGTAEACAALARMVANGEGGGRDDLAAVKLEILATTLRTEALFRHEHEQDGVAAPTPQPPAPPPRRGQKGPDIAPEVVAERDLQHRQAELSRGALEAWLNGVQNGMAIAQKGERQGLSRDPSLPTLPPLDRVMAGSGSSAGSAASSKCQGCQDACGNLERCASDDFAGGRCSQLRCPAGQSCPPFDACVGECTARADQCARGCGDCSGGAKAGGK